MNRRELLEKVATTCAAFGVAGSASCIEPEPLCLVLTLPADSTYEDYDYSALCELLKSQIGDVPILVLTHGATLEAVADPRE